MAVFDKGDIIRVCLNPASGKEIQGDFRPCLVLSPKKFNRLGMSFIAPISQGDDFSRFQGFTVPLMGTGTETQGVVMINAVRMVDLSARKSKKIESAPESLVEEVLAILSAIIE